jgi:hypothetical protein
MDPPAGAYRIVGQHDQTFEAIFATPTRANIRWSDAVGLVVYYGGTVTASGGSAHKFTMANDAQALILQAVEQSPQVVHEGEEPAMNLVDGLDRQLRRLLRQDAEILVEGFRR